jgi:TPR repeat protein
MAYHRLTTLLAMALLPFGAMATTVDLAFEPPEIDAQPICSTAVPDGVLIQTWTNWDGASLQGRTTDGVRADLRRLMEMDAVKWYDTIDRMITLLPSVDPKFDEAKAMVERIDLMIAAGKLRELTNQRLVPQLLASAQASSPRIQKSLADMVTRGVGIDADPVAGLRLLVAAANGGNADAILELVQMQLAGKSLPDWDVDPDLAVTMAFGALVGQLDAQICDRVTRIAREYKNGDVVTQNYGLAERWYRFAADLGDASAAWKVADFHMRSEEITKDNAVFLKYLTLAADGGTAYAQVSLGRVYEIGALVPRDLDRAAALYAQAAASGDRGGIIRQMLFLQQQSKTDPSLQPAYLAALDTLVKTPGAPSWAFTTAADTVLKQKGRWAGEAEAIALLEKAAAMQDTDAIQRLALMRMRGTTSANAFYANVDDLIFAMQQSGKSRTMVDLQQAFLCRAPAAPQIDEAAYWRDAEASTAAGSGTLDEQALLDLAASPDPLVVARLQSQALYGRPSAMAQYLTLIEAGDFAVVQKAFWEDYATRFDKVLQARGNLAIKLARNEAERAEALGYLRLAVAQGEAGAGLYLAAALLDADRPTDAALAEAQRALLPLADQGVGAAMLLLSKADPASFPNIDTVFRAYADVIEARGDFDAVLMAIPRLHVDARIADYKRRATVSTACSFDQVVKMADVMGRIGDKAGFQTWINISDALAEGDGWRLTQLADTLVRHGTTTDAARAFEFYEAAFTKGSKTAINRLLARYSDDDTADYDPARSALLYIALVNQSDPEELPDILRRIENDDAAIREAAYTKIVPRDLYLTAAEAGQPIAMREYALLIRGSATTPAEVEAATDWLARASAAGDVDAMVEYARALAFGVGVATGPSPDEAVVWLNKAAAAGNDEAKTLMNALGLTGKVTQ